MSTILDLLSSIPTAAALKERVELIREQAKALEKQIEKLEGEIADLKKENAQLKSELASKTSAEEFVENRGALFKRKPEGGYHLAVYCAICHSATASLDGDEIPYCCTSRCGWIASFSPRALSSVMKELP